MKGVRQVADATCLACGCLCDDIVLSVADDRIVKAEKACPIGEQWFLADRASDLPACRLDELHGDSFVCLHTENVPPPNAGVSFVAATSGIYAGGTVFRCDGVPLPLGAALPLPYPTAEFVLQSIGEILSRS